MRKKILILATAMLFSTAIVRAVTVESQVFSHYDPFERITVGKKIKVWVNGTMRDLLPSETKFETKVTNPIQDASAMFADKITIPSSPSICPNENNVVILWTEKELNAPYWIGYRVDLDACVKNDAKNKKEPSKTYLPLDEIIIKNNGKYIVFYGKKAGDILKAQEYRKNEKEIKAKEKEIEEIDKKINVVKTDCNKKSWLEKPGCEALNLVPLQTSREKLLQDKENLLK